MFKFIRHIDDVLPAVADKKEIRFLEQPNGITVGCYMFMDGHTFDAPEALECRGIAFDRSGEIVSRPLHKFFNIGEKPWLTPEAVMLRDDVAAVYEKLDGSMISTAWIDDRLHWRSKKSFTSDVVRLAEQFLSQEENEYIATFAHMVACSNHTASFELTHPQARIVVEQEKPAMRLLHIRHNNTGEYVLLNKQHHMWDLIEEMHMPMAWRFEIDAEEALRRVETMEGSEGYVIQFTNGDMCKLKCPWYRRLHRSITFLRERNIAELALTEELDDVKAALTEAGVDLAAVLEVETRLKNILIAISDEVERIYQESKALDRKSYAIKHKEHPLFSLAMSRYIGKELELSEWYRKRRLRDDFSLRVLANSAQVEELEM